ANGADLPPPHVERGPLRSACRADLPPGVIHMERTSASDFHPEVLKLFDRYVHGLLDRRGFLEGAGKYAAVGTTAVGLLEALSPNYAEAAQQITKDDARIKGEYV